MAKRNKLQPVNHYIPSSELSSYVIPAGVSMADISKQKPVSKWDPVYRYYYSDYEFSCRDCSQVEVWTVKQQRQWYEEQGGAPESVAIRCNECRRKRRSR